MTSTNSVSEICSRLRLLLEEAVKKNPTEGILLSGGLDTSVLAVIASKFTPLKAFTVALKGVPAPDIEYAKLIAEHLGLQHFIYIFDENAVLEALPKVIEITKSFDPMEIRNSLTIFLALKFAKNHGINTIMAGDGCDELFAGYSFLFNLGKNRLIQELQKLGEVMSFSSILLAEALKIEVKLPYLYPAFKSFAMEIDPKYKVRREGGQTWGKWIIRKSFENLLPKEIVWRPKTPIEYGSGTTTLPTLFNQKISNQEFERKREEYLSKDKVIIRDKEQLFYYEIFRKVVGIPQPYNSKAKICPYCNSNVPLDATYCRTCGAYPI
ncbi:hypothetical protein KEJ26_00195 [Candidatus Bathyarchaeota archaeon]|nr:hypothetical protein [Candidatus Bathyarchaeota archaeon]